jgi:hypothetical protein
MTVSPGIAKALFSIANSLVKIVTYRYFKKYYPFEFKNRLLYCINLGLSKKLNFGKMIELTKLNSGNFRTRKKWLMFVGASSPSL